MWMVILKPLMDGIQWSGQSGKWIMEAESLDS